jgi:hypothetical protein
MNSTKFSSLVKKNKTEILPYSIMNWALNFYSPIASPSLGWGLAMGE